MTDPITSGRSGRRVRALAHWENAAFALRTPEPALPEKKKGGPKAKPFSKGVELC